MIRNNSTTRIVRWLAAAALFTTAAIALLFGPSRLDYPAPFYAIHLSSVIDSFILAAMFYSSIGLIVGKRAAWQVAMSILAISALWEIIESKDGINLFSILPLIVLMVVGATRHYYQIDNGPSGATLALRRAFLFTLATTLIGCIAFSILARSEHHQFALLPSILASLDYMYSLSSIFEPLRQPAVSHVVGRIILFSLGILNYLLIALALLKPVVDRFHLTALDHQRVRNLLEKYSTSGEDYFKYFPHDKSYFFSTDNNAFIAYGVHNNTCIALADPIAANFDKQLEVLREFQVYCATHGWQLAFIAVSPSSRRLYSIANLKTIKIGENAIVQLNSPMEPKPDKKMRNIVNRFSKAGYYIQIKKPHHSSALMNELQQISNDWLQHGNRKERQFAMGYFDTNYLQKCNLCIVRDSRGNAQAFANLQPNYSQAKQASIDLMRSAKNAPPNTMDYLFISLIQHLRTEDWQMLDLGLAPLSGLDRAKHINERSLHLLYLYANRWFAFRGLRRFKDKFQPIWEPRFLAYSGSSSQLATVAVALSELTKFKQH